MRFLLSVSILVLMAGTASAESFVTLRPRTTTAPDFTVIAPPKAARPAADVDNFDGSAPDGVDPLVTLSYPDNEPEPAAIEHHAIVPDNETEVRQLSPSVVMFGKPAPVDKKQEAATYANAPHKAFALPVMIRGGIAGEAFARPAAPEAPQPASTPDVATGPGSGGGGKAGAAPARSKGPEAPQPAVAPPAASGPPAIKPE